MVGPGGAACDTAGDQSWTKYQFTFDTTRPAFTGEQLTFQVQLLGARSWAFGFESDHASKIAIDPAPLPRTGLEFGATVGSPADGSSTLEGETVVAGGSYDFPDLGEDPTGASDHPTTRKVEVSVDDAASRFTVRPVAEVQWQVVHRNGATSADGWRPATGLEDWSFTFDTADDRPGSKTPLGARRPS